MNLKIVICTVEVIVRISGIPVFGKTDLKGKVTSENQSSYIVDFTQSIDKEYVGDYTQVKLDKNKCIEVEK